eukprot:746762-Hanusia_phi.AAC.3
MPFDRRRRVRLLCASLKRLDALIHVSTAYVNSPIKSTGLIPEEFRYLGKAACGERAIDCSCGGRSIPVDYLQLKSSIEKMSRDEVIARTDEILESSGHWPNSGRGEYGVPTGATGWIDTLVGPTGLVLAVAGFPVALGRPVGDDASLQLGSCTWLLVGMISSSTSFLSTSLSTPCWLVPGLSRPRSS